MDEKSQRNLEELDISVADAAQVASKQDVYKTDITKSGYIKQPNTEENRQISLNEIDSSKSKKTSGIIVRKIYKKYHIMRAHDVVKKLQQIIKKVPQATIPFHDFAKDLPPHVVITFGKPATKGSRLPAIAMKKSIPKDVFGKMVKDFLKELHQYLPKSDYEQLEK